VATTPERRLLTIPWQLDDEQRFPDGEIGRLG
jgi:hypothetical protein